MPKRFLGQNTGELSAVEPQPNQFPLFRPMEFGFSVLPASCRREEPLPQERNNPSPIRLTTMPCQRDAGSTLNAYPRPRTASVKYYSAGTKPSPPREPGFLESTLEGGALVSLDCPFPGFSPRPFVVVSRGRKICAQPEKTFMQMSIKIPDAFRLTTPRREIPSPRFQNRQDHAYCTGLSANYD